MTDETANKMIKQLKRIADALEKANANDIFGEIVAKKKKLEAEIAAKEEEGRKEGPAVSDYDAVPPPAPKGPQLPPDDWRLQ